MLLLLRPLSVGALLIAIGVGLIYYSAKAGSRCGLDFAKLATQPCQLDDTYPGDEEMERRRQLVLCRVAAKDEVVRELLAERLTLLQAAARVRAVERLLPLPWDPPRCDLADGERLCRTVMAIAEGYLNEYLPEQAGDVAARLQAELEQHRGPDGVVRLPD
jgi:hypothetical protein